MDASRPFNADMLSAKRQFMGMLGLLEPSKRILAAADAMSFGSVEAMSGLLRMPSSKTLWVSCGIEYVSKLFCVPLAPLAPLLWLFTFWVDMLLVKPSQ